MSRLASATETKGGSAQWSRTYSYDHFGNRWISGATGHTLHSATPTSSAAIEATTNRLASTTGAVYDNAGNMTAHPFITPGSGSMTYDANNKMTAFMATGVSVNTIYDATGKRVRKVHNGQTTVWVYDAFGRLAAEYTTATLYDTPGTYYRTTDHLGSTRLVTDAGGAVKQRRDYFPFGEEIEDTLSGRGAVEDGGVGTYNASLSLRQQFTGQQRDEETGLDYFWARNYSAACGRFLGLDTYWGSGISQDPQTWSRFAYVMGNPLLYTDPSGRQAVPIPPVGRVPETQCASLVIAELHQYGYPGGLDDYLNSAVGILGVTTFLENSGNPSVSMTDPLYQSWVGMGFVFANRYSLSDKNKEAAGFTQSLAFRDTVIEGSQVFADGRMKEGFSNRLLGILRGDPAAEECDGPRKSLGAAARVVQTAFGYTPFLRGTPSTVSNPVGSALFFVAAGTPPPRIHDSYALAYTVNVGGVQFFDLYQWVRGGRPIRSRSYFRLRKIEPQGVIVAPLEEAGEPGGQQ